MDLDTKRDPDGGWYDRFVRVVDDDGTVIEDFGKHPTLNELREAERELGERINLWQKGLICKECGNQITDRFSARPDGHLLCWNCASAEEGEERGDLRMNVDPTQSVLSESKLYEKSLCDYVINVATGCRHGCRFCYVPSTPAIDSRDEMLFEQADVDNPQEDWGSYLLYRDDLPERLHEGLQDKDFSEWQKTDRGRGIVMLSSGTDCYQDRRAAQITRSCVHELIEHDVPVRILTRSPNVTRDIELFKQAGERITVGMSIPSFDASLVRALEPNAPPPQERWEALDQLYRTGVPRFVSFSPTYPTMSKEDIHEAMSWFAAIDPDVVFHEPINPRGINFELCVEATRKAGYVDVARELEKLQHEDTWVEYSLEHIQLVREVADSFDNIDLHTWPDQRLISAVDGETRQNLMRLKSQVSPEQLC